MNTAAVQSRDSAAATRIEIRHPGGAAAAVWGFVSGILKQTTIGRRNRVLEAPALIKAFNDLERQLGSPEGDTVHSEPSRRVPHRRN